jgi:CO/xanthine dehydrogenase FAD-binding subunit
MKPPPFKYIAPSTVDEALNVLSSQRDDVKILAGGRSLTPMLNFRLVHPEMLVDINRIKELAFIAESAQDCESDLSVGTERSKPPTASKTSAPSLPRRRNM